MGKLSEIAEGYINLINKNQMIEEIAKERLEVCKPCNKNSDNNPSLRTSISFCTECGCILASKARSPESSCPLKKWKDDK